jgi:hypothetical protein
LLVDVQEFDMYTGGLLKGVKENSVLCCRRELCGSALNYWTLRVT